MKAVFNEIWKAGQDVLLENCILLTSLSHERHLWLQIREVLRSEHIHYRYRYNAFIVKGVCGFKVTLYRFLLINSKELADSDTITCLVIAPKSRVVA